MQHAIGVVGRLLLALRGAQFAVVEQARQLLGVVDLPVQVERVFAAAATSRVRQAR
jgi:hypothetical protein